MKEVLLKGNDRMQVTQAIDTTRRMRMAALYPPDLSSRGELGTPSFYNPQAILGDAELLTTATARLVVALTSSLSQQEQRDRLRDRNAEFAQKYGSYDIYRWTDPKEDRSTQQLDYAGQAFTLSWEAGIGFHFTLINKIPLPVEKIISPTIGVVAPLTTDYYLAMMGHEFVQQNVQDEIFDVKPAAVNFITGEVIFPKDTNGKTVFSDKESLVVFVDFLETGNTAITVYEALRSIYRDKTIFSALTLPDLPHDQFDY